MFVLYISNSTADILRVLPCSFCDYISLYKNKSNDDISIEFIDHSAFPNDKDVGEFLSHPTNYMFMSGRDPSDNRLIKKETATATVEYLDIKEGSNSIAIPDGIHYLGIKTLVASGGRGSASVKGGCGASLRNVVLDISTANTLLVNLGKAGTKDDPNAYPLEVIIDGNTVYKLGGGAGSLDNGSSVPPHQGDLYDPYSGSGGFWELSVGGPALNGNSRSTSSVIDGFGGGGNYNEDGQLGLADIFFSDVRPNINGPLISNRRIAQHSKCSSRVDGDIITLGAGTSTIGVSGDKPYLCLVSACAGGGYGTDGTGGQGSSQSVTWWALYPFQNITFTVGKGGDVSTPDGGTTSITYTYNGRIYPLLSLGGGKGNGTGGKVLVSNGTNSYEGRDNCQVHPGCVIGNYGSGGTKGNNGADGTLSYVFSALPPSGVKVYDALEDPLYLA